MLLNKNHSTEGRHFLKNNKFLFSTEGRIALASAMIAPIRRNLNYLGLAHSFLIPKKLRIICY
jgi:hypothetical protein